MTSAERIADLERAIRYERDIAEQALSAMNEAEARLAMVTKALAAAERRIVDLHKIGTKYFKVAAGDITADRALIHAALHANTNSVLAFLTRIEHRGAAKALPLIERALAVAERLSDQQAMPDDGWMVEHDAIRAAIDEIVARAAELDYK